MKKHTIILITLLTLLSCNDDFLERPPLDTLTNKNFWQNEAHLFSAANALYTAMNGKDILNTFESMGETAPWAITTAYRTIGGGNYSTDISQINNLWGRAYYNIGQCNYFLNNYRRAITVSENIRERYAAEAYFFRAYDYWLLTSLFGDVPYITKELNVYSEDVYRGRDTRQTIVDSIAADLERSYQNLPAFISPASAQFGRISQGAALTLLSRIYLYNERWDKAASAAKRAMGLGYELYSTGNPENDYRNLFNFTGRASRVSTNKETILAYVYNFDLGEEARTSHNLSRELWVPNDFSRFAPTKKMIEKWLTADGKIWNPATVNTYEEVFENRDPRMKQSLLTPNTPWEGKKDGNPNNTNTSVFTYPKFSNDKDGCMTYSGYYLYKYVEPSKVRQVGQDDNDIIFFRYAEVLLNYIEARERSGGITQATLDSTINLLRNRVGMVNLTLSNIPAGSDIRTEIRRERTVELFFEGHRYLDLIRWREAEVLGEDLLGVNRRWLDENKLSAGILNTLKWKTVNGEQYLIIESGRTFNPAKHYLLSLPLKQMQRNPNLKPNNPGWD
ncbi:MAG: RagB/SusD family nutrient uptake outer membrane protein [Paludibacter sp.]|nr:RagB/SusD family nutrient uptake outer membrane protein [Paludibacter sp.]MDD4428106.1 RagB/SusD family nutrient uptake outer membrane protein [Paludibacter sp.]